MPKFTGREAPNEPKDTAPPKPQAASDSELEHTVRDAKELPPKQESAAERETPRSPLVSEIVGRVERAREGSVTFIGGFQDPREFRESLLHMPKDAVVISHQSFDTDSPTFDQILSRVKRAKDARPDAKIIVDSEFLLTQVLDNDATHRFSTGEKEMFKTLTRGGRGAATDTALAGFFRKKADGETAPTMEDRIHAALERLAHFMHAANIHDAAFELPQSGFAFALLAYVRFGRLDARGLDEIRLLGADSAGKAAEMRLDRRHVEVSIGGKSFKKELRQLTARGEAHH